MYTESVGNFYSPLQSPEGSLYRVDAPNRCLFPPVKFTREQVSISKHSEFQITFVMQTFNISFTSCFDPVVHCD